MNTTLTLVAAEKAEMLLPFVRKYHLFEEVVMNDAHRAQVLTPLFGESSVGRIWLVSSHDIFIGYIAICFCYSIEFGGREAFIDEFYLDEAYRGKGIGTQVLKLVFEESEKLSIRAIHLEVAKTNVKAINLYTQIGFAPRAKYDLYTYELPGTSD